MKVPFIDLQSQHKEIVSAVDRAFKALMRRGDFILGQDTRKFEKAFAKFIGSKYALGVNSGTDALFLGLLSLGVGPGDEVIVPAYTYIASAFAVSYTGAKPVFVDIDEKTCNMNPEKLEKVISKQTKAVMPVHLYGQSADMDPIIAIAKKHSLRVIEDAAQAQGTEYHGSRVTGHVSRKVGSMGDIGCFSFYPTKNLGAFGDAGMLTTNSEEIFEKLKKLRDYGRKTRYEHVSLGYNSRLDSIQAAILNVKLKKLAQWNNKRRLAAAAYNKLLSNEKNIGLFPEAKYGKHIYHIYAVRVKNRDNVLESLKENQVHAAVHYPVPLHLQEVYKNLGYRNGDFPVAEAISKEVLCLPIFPHITKRQIEFVVETLKKAVKS